MYRIPLLVLMSVLHPEKKQLEMTYHWTIDCNYRFKKRRKHYTAQYDLASKQFVK